MKYYLWIFRLISILFLISGLLGVFLPGKVGDYCFVMMMLNAVMAELIGIKIAILKKENEKDSRAFKVC